MPHKTILLVEDDYFSRLGLRAYLRDQGYRVLEAYHAQGALATARTEGPDVAIVNIVIPVDSGEVRADADKSTGLRLVRKLKKVDSDLGVVILSSYGDRGEEVLEMLKTMRGIVYLIKGLHQPEQLQQAIRFAQRGDIWIDPVVDLTSEGKASNLLRTLFSGDEAQIIERALVRVQQLTPAEREVLKGAGRGRTTKGLAQELSVSTGTIESHINRIYAKLFGSAVDTGKFRRSVLLAKVALLDLLREQES